MPSKTWADIISAYIQQRLDLKLEPAQKERDAALKKADNTVSVAAIEAEYADSVAELVAKYQVSTWLDNAAKRGSHISLATHAAKFTHGDAQGSSILSLHHDANEPYLSTVSVPEPDIDIVGSAGALDVAGLLMLECDGVALYQCVKAKEGIPFSDFSQDTKQIQFWLDGFSAALLDPKLSSCALAKQVYFPLDDGSYHILGPLFATSFAQCFNDAIGQSRYSEEAKAIRASRRGGVHHDKDDVMFLNTAVQTFGGANKQNISLLNVRRRGETVLLTCAPPVWQEVSKPPVNDFSIFFSRDFTHRVNPSVKAFQQYLLAIRHRDSTYEIRKTVAEHVNTLADIVLDYAAQIQSLTGRSGWSQQDCRLSPSQSLWLDIGCSVPEFQRDRAKKDWMRDISQAFAEWLNLRLNKALNDNGLVFDVVQFNHWEKLFWPRLCEFEHGTEVFNVPDVEVTA